MNVKISDLMARRVIIAQPHHTVEHVRGLMERNRISAVPVIGPDGEAVGIVTATDLVAELKNGTPVSQIMTGRARLQRCPCGCAGDAPEQDPPRRRYP